MSHRIFSKRSAHRCMHAQKVYHLSFKWPTVTSTHPFFPCNRRFCGLLLFWWLEHQCPFSTPDLEDTPDESKTIMTIPFLSAGIRAGVDMWPNSGEQTWAEISWWGRRRASEKGFLSDKKGLPKVMSYLVFHILVLLHRTESACGACLTLLHLVHDHEEKLACIENWHITTAEEKDKTNQITGDITELLSYPTLEPSYLPNFLLRAVISCSFCVS